MYKSVQLANLLVFVVFYIITQIILNLTDGVLHASLQTF